MAVDDHELVVMSSPFLDSLHIGDAYLLLNPI